jgi:hypothetical protein
MAELEQSCCSPQTQATCCEPADKAACCGPEGCEPCGCAPADDATPDDIREAVRAKYAQYAVASSGTVASPADREGAFGAALYSDSEDGATEAATKADMQAWTGRRLPPHEPPQQVQVLLPRFHRVDTAQYRPLLVATSSHHRCAR